jgi:hypothetical protein
MLLPALLALLAASPISQCVPARWPSSDPASLSLLDDSPINCLLLEPGAWSEEFLRAARSRQLILLAVPGQGGEAAAKRAAALGFDGIVLEEGVAGAGNLQVIHLPARSKITLPPVPPASGTQQGLWPGVRIEKDGAFESRPSGGPWIETNAGVLRFLRAAAPPGVAIWIANLPPEGQILGPRRYKQAISDAALTGSRWVLALDKDFSSRLLQREPKALSDWRDINTILRFYQAQQAVLGWPDSSALALLESPATGALFSGGIVDMIAAKNIPLRVVPTIDLTTRKFAGLRMFLNLDPALLEPEQKEAVRAISRAGATVVNGPPGWRIALPEGGGFVFDKEQIHQLDEMWREVNGLVGRQNFGVRVFGAPSTLSNLKFSPNGDKLALHLVNYSDYPVESITVHALGKWRKVTLLTPRAAKQLEPYAVENGTAADIEKLDDTAILLFEEGEAAQPNR